MFTRNASEAVNLVAHAWGTANLKPGDEVISSAPARPVCAMLQGLTICVPSSSIMRLGHQLAVQGANNSKMLCLPARFAFLWALKLFHGMRRS